MYYLVKTGWCLPRLYARGFPASDLGRSHAVVSGVISPWRCAECEIHWCLQAPISYRQFSRHTLADCAKGCNAFRTLSPSVDLRNLNRTSFGSSWISLSTVKYHATATSLSLGFRVPRIRECVKRDALFRGRAKLTVGCCVDFVG